MDSRKRAVSIRLSAADVRKVKQLADRLGVRDSDVIRFAIKSMLSKLGPLHDPLTRGRNLVPVFLECGHEVFQHFDLDVGRLEAIVNDGVEPESRVDHEDIRLLVMNGASPPYVRWSLERRPAQAAARSANGTAASPSAGGNGRDHSGVDELRKDSKGAGVPVSVRAYLYDKYLYGDGTL